MLSRALNGGITLAEELKPRLRADRMAESGKASPDSRPGLSRGTGGIASDWVRSTPTSPTSTLPQVPRAPLVRLYQSRAR